MKMLLRSLAVVAVGLVLVNGQSQAGGSAVGMVLHITNPSYSACDDALVDEATVTCGDVVTSGTVAPPAGAQLVWVLAFGASDATIPGWGTGPASGMGGVQFGITYTNTVDVVGWVLCTGGAEIPQNDPVTGVWPENNTGNAITFAGGCVISANPDLWYRVGYYTVSAGSEGRMTIQTDPRTGLVEFTDCNTSLFEMDPLDTFSSVDVGGTQLDGEGRKSCSEPVPTLESTWTELKDSYTN